MTNSELAELIERVVRDVPGVTDLFATAGAAERAAAALRSTTPPVVTVQGRTAVTRILISVGVSASAPDVAAEVGAAVREALLVEPRASDATAIAVRVGRVSA